VWQLRCPDPPASAKREGTGMERRGDRREKGARGEGVRWEV